MGSTAPASSVRVAVAQYEPEWLDLAGSVKKVCSIISEAASKGAKILAFSEVFIPGYPAWIWCVQNPHNPFPYPYHTHIHTQKVPSIYQQPTGPAPSTRRSRRDISKTHSPSTRTRCGPSSRARGSTASSLCWAFPRTTTTRCTSRRRSSTRTGRC